MFSLVAAKSIKRIEDLKGKAVAVSNPLGIQAYVTQQILKKYGLDPGKDCAFSIWEKNQPGSAPWKPALSRRPLFNLPPAWY